MKAVKIKTVSWLLPLLLSGLCGCDPMSPEDRAFFEQQGRERANRQALLHTANESLASGDLIRRVRESAAPDGEGTVDDWLGRRFAEMGGQVMFPRWTAARRGSNKQEISLEFVHIDPSNMMARLAYAWDLDVLDMTVGPPRFSRREDMTSPEESLAQQQLRRIREHEKQLE